MKRTVISAAVLAVLVTGLLADGMIVPVRPDLHVRGSWAVKYHNVDIKVREQVADVTIDQAFVNTGGGDIEVEYFFPVPPGSAVDKMTLIVDGKEMEAKLLEADKARKIYEDIVRSKKDPALLEYAGFGLYRTRAFPLSPGKPCRVVVKYKYICKMDSGVVEVWYPLNTEKFSSKPIEKVEVRVDIQSSGDLSAIYSPSHDVTVTHKAPKHAIVTWQKENITPHDDFILYYRPGSKDVEAVFLTYRPGDENMGYFLMMLSPNPKLKGNVVSKDIVFIIDRSGSMSGKRITQAKEALAFCLNNLNDGDRFNVVHYSDSVDTFFASLVNADGGNVKKAIGLADAIEAGGGTDIHSALRKGLKQFDELEIARQANRPQYIVFLTDGLPTVGKTDENTILEDTKKANRQNVRIFALGVGYNVNIRLLDNLTAQNGGKSDYVKETESAEAKITNLYKKIKNPVMTGLDVNVSEAKFSDMYPRELRDLFDGDQIVAVGRYTCDGSKGQLVLKGTLEGKQAAFEYPVEFTQEKADMRFAFVEKIWATRRIGFLLDQIQLHGKQDKELTDELIALSMKHGIITPYTSYLADENVKLENEKMVWAEASRQTSGLSRRSSGVAAQQDAAARQALNYGYMPSAKSNGKVAVVGNTSQSAYEADKVETVESVRQVSNRTMYRRDNVWKTADVAKFDMQKNADQIVKVQRFSDEYFKLVSANNIEENQVLASQLAGEQLLVKLRGQVYLIE